MTDNSGAVVPKAAVRITNTDENTSREVLSNVNGDYESLNMKPGHYSVEVKATGFQVFSTSGLLLVARQVLRLDVGLQVGQLAETVSVEANAGVIATDTQTIQATFDNRALLDLPGNIRAAGSTSPYALISALPGVQADDSSNFSIQGGLQSTSQFSLDGISITNVGGNSPLTNAFPSVESIAEIKVQGVGNNAEYGQAGDVTTISKSGTNQLHGALFWYHQNRALDARAYGALDKPQKIANDYGASVGGPVWIPGLYNGKDKTFFFGTFEGFKFPLGKTVQNRVPTQALRNGDFTQEGVAVKDPLTGKPFPNGVIPSDRISSVAQGFLSLYPLPNAGDLNVVHDANFITNRSNTYNSNQYDVRVDHYLTSKMSIFGRWTWKDINQDQPQDLLVPSKQYTDKYKLFVVSHNWALRPNLLNEFRFGFTLNPNGTTLPFDGRQFTNSLGLQGVGPDFPFNGLPDLSLGNFTGLTTDRGDALGRNDTYQWNNNTTWTLGRHTIKFGIDFRRIRAVSALSFLSGDNYGYYNFSGSFTGDPFGDFLLGIPHDTSIDNVQRDNDGRSVHYAAFAQDSFRVSPRLTLEYGLRWEYHPAYNDASGNIGNFDPSVPKSGRVIYPTGKESLLAPGYLASFNACPAPDANGAPCTPVLSAKDANLPEGLRTAPTRVVPRFGFAFRPFSNDKTVLRGGFGAFDTPSLGSIFYALTGTLQSDTRTFINIGPQGGPVFQWPEIRTGGSGIQVGDFGNAYFGTANDIDWREPYSMQWNLSIDRDLGFSTGLRVSYIGMGTRDLVWAPNLNQSYYSTQFYAAQPLSRRPFPNWGTVNNRSVGANADYHSMQVEVTHRFQRGLTFNSTYTFAKNIADNQGPVPDHFADENAGARALDLYDRRAERGDVYGTRRQRWITTAVYELPFGRGRHFMSSSNRLLDGLLGGWRLSSIFLVQTGPYLTPYFNDGDPSGTGSGFQRPQHPDRLKSGSLDNPTRDQWVDPTAFVCPGTPGWVLGQPCTIGSDPRSALAPIGRFGNSGVAVVTGPGTINLSLGMGKAFMLTEGVKLKFEGSFTNVPNHVNLDNPEMRIDNNNFGQITRARGSEFGGSRTGQVSARIEF